MALINCPECNKEISDKAGACPNCGLPLEKLLPVTPPSTPPATIVETAHDPNKKHCPSCKSENTQSIKMMCLSGTSSGSSTGVGVSSDLDIGVGRLNSNSQTALAERFTPSTSPASTAAGCGCFSLIAGLVILCIGMASDADGSGFAAFLGVVGLILGGVMMASSNNNKNPQQVEWEAKINLYENGFICHKCGRTWIP